MGIYTCENCGKDVPHKLDKYGHCNECQQGKL